METTIMGYIRSILGFSRVSKLNCGEDRQDIKSRNVWDTRKRAQMVVSLNRGALKQVPQIL